MSVTLEQVQGAVDAFLAKHRPRYRALPCVVVEIVKAGLDRHRGFTAERCAIQGYDPESLPGVGRIAHECGHGLHENAGGDPRIGSVRDDDPVLVPFWRILGCTTSLADAIAHARETGEHDDRPTEILADAFEHISLGTPVRREAGEPTTGFRGIFGRYGGDLEANRAELDAFFRQLRPGAVPPTPRADPRFIPPTPTSDVETRIAAFWKRVESMDPDEYLTAAEIGGWALNLMEREPAARVKVRRFTDVAMRLQAALDEARTP